ncbi:MAG TPA: cobalamin-binding protein [Solirubrobacterales bacterium]|nr:cobalamin-binding protein [Solirubrobacterales bacterium]
MPSSTEMLFALGLGDQVVAVTHECDWPPEAASIPHLTRTIVPAGLSAAEIDRTVRETVGAGRPLYELDAGRLAELDPELIVTQAVCDVCAVSYDDVVAVAATLPSKPRVLSLDPMTLDDVLDDVRRLGDAAGVTAESRLLREQARRRIDAVARAVAGAPRPRVAAIEWLDPVFIGGHWVPEMIGLAGGDDVLGKPGERSRTAEWDEVAAAEPDIVIAMPCGYDAARSAEEAELFEDALAAAGAERVVAVDASAYFSRPGPRLVTGIELLGHLLHPDRVPAPPGAEHVDVAMAGAGGGT